MTDSDAGEEKYRQQLWGYDAAGRVTRSVGPAQEARFSRDAAGNRTEAPGQKVWHNLLQRLNGIRLAYDGFGRLAERRDTRHGVTQRFRWDEENRLSDVELEGHRDYRRAEYRYDLLGRRTHKLLYRHGRAKPETVTFQWNGLRLAGEAGSGAPGKKTQYVYSEGSWEPLARVDSSAAGSEVYWYHTALNGLPEQMTDAQGDTVWQGTFSTWGETQREQSHAPLAVAQNLRFQGQYLDRDKSAGADLNSASALAPKGRASWMRRVFGPALQSVPVLRPGHGPLHAAGPDRAGGRTEHLCLRRRPAGMGGSAGVGSMAKR